MSKYEPLEHFLRTKTASEIPIRFSEIEAVIGQKLPPVAHTQRAWWSNNPSNNVMTKAWLAAGYVSERVDMGAQRLVFRRQAAPSSPAAPGGATAVADRAPPTDWLTELRAKLAGIVTFVDGVDLTAPTGEVWDAER